jgi:molybdopterin molybdotransferase
LPALFAAMGQARPRPELIALADSFGVSTDLASFLPVCVEFDAEGRAWAMPRPTNGSGDFASLAGTCGFVQLPPGPGALPRGFAVRLYRW